MMEVLLVVAMLAALFALAAPRFTVVRDESAARSARLQLGSAFAAARAAAVQKGKPATVTIDGTDVTVTVLSGLEGTEVTVLGPMRFNGTTNALLTSVSGVTEVVYDPRGMVTPALDGIAKFALSAGEVSDTLCISASGLVLPKDCRQ
jgi:Tfp pilus assembly protein FimT